MKNKQVIIKIVSLIMLLSFITYVSFVSFFLYRQVLSEKGFSPDYISDTLKYNIYGRQQYINTYGLIQKVLGKRAIDDFSILKSDYGKLIRINEENDLTDIHSEADQILPIFSYCRSYSIPCVYLTSILPLQSEEDIPYHGMDHQAKNAEELLEYLKSCDIPYYDLRVFGSVKSIPKKDLFYKTDHHWSMACCFATFQDLIDRLNQDYDLKLNDEFTDIDSYSPVIWEQSFLGSYGVKVGKYYAGKDDFVVYTPEFPTDMLFESYDNQGSLLVHKEGEWLDCLMDSEILDDQDYDNKYNAWSNYGYIENRVVNRLADNDLKLLYISHSYGRPMTQYLATCFREVRNLDPQEGRFCGNYLDYIDEYKPDIVIIQGESEGTLYGVYNTSR